MCFFTFSMIGHLLVLFASIPVVWAEAKPVDIFNNPGEGDILQLRNLIKNDTKAYNALYSLSSKKWNITDEDGNIVIPYTITGKFNLSEEATIANAMQRVMDNTCIRFIKHTDEQDYIDFVNKPGEGCYTSVGRQGGRTVVQLESNEVATCMKTNLVLHELLHVVGLWHEHQRHDRDSYVQILYENVFKDFHDQFIKITTNQATTYDVPYDYKSLMHYGKNAFAMPYKVSMLTKDPNYQDVIGQQEDASPNDYFKVCKIYNCKKCHSTSLVQNDTFLLREYD